MVKPHLYLVYFITVVPLCLLAEEDYYTLLGIGKHADLREIRQAFKKLAVLHHPDKNPDDPDSHDNFIKLAEAYDILKDPTKRKDYDLYGKKNFKNHAPPRYHSYTYYRDQFGIYDDDPQVATLSGDDFESSVLENAWFINFYSPLCGHCHDLAPEWRELARNLEGVVKIGAVNCEDDRMLCRSLNIRQYPTLMYYGEKATMHEGTEYFGRNTAEAMEKYVMNLFSASFQVEVLKDYPETGFWVFFLCAEDGNCVEENTRTKLAAVLRGLVSVGFTDNNDVIEKLNTHYESKVMFWTRKDGSGTSVDLDGGNFIDLALQALHLLPEAEKLDEGGFQRIRTQLRMGEDEPWVLCFTLGMDTEKTVILKKLKASLKGVKIGEINCARCANLCASLHINRYPTWAILKVGGAFEVHNGRSSLHAVEKFARETQVATNLHALSPQDLMRIMAEGTPWLIGWLLTGCPPCKKMLPALRKASNHFTPEVIQFGTVDCAMHSHVCSRYNVHMYPTTAIYNASSVFTFEGDPDEKAIVDFIRMMKYNYVTTLTMDNFHSEVGAKSEQDIYVVEFYAPWCGPCQKLQPEWRKMAQKLSHLKHVSVGAVNCELNRELCLEQVIKSYPTIRLYPTGSHGLNTMAIYASYERDATALHKWVLNFIPSSIVQLNAQNYKTQLLSKREDRTWVIMFMAPWCGYCHQFEPEFVTVIQRLEHIVVGGKVDCQREGTLCHQEGINSYPSVKLFQRVDGVTRLNGGITIEGFTSEALYSEISLLAANAYITPVEHDEL